MTRGGQDIQSCWPKVSSCIFYQELQLKHWCTDCWFDLGLTGNGDWGGRGGTIWMMCADSMSTSRSLSSQNTPTCSISGHAEKEGTMSKTSRTLRRWITVSSAEYKGHIQTQGQCGQARKKPQDMVKTQLPIFHASSAIAGQLTCTEVFQSWAGYLDVGL